MKLCRIIINMKLTEIGYQGSMFLQNVIIYPSTWFHIPEGLNVHVETAKRYVKNLITKTFSTVPMRQSILVHCKKGAKHITKYLLNLQHIPQVCKNVCMTFIFQNVSKTTETYRL